MRNIPKETILKAAAGDIEAFERIYRTFSAYVYTLAFRVTGNKEDAEEVTQDVFVSVHRNLWKFRFRSSLKTWIYRVSVNKAINAYRKRVRRLSRSAELDENRAGAEDRTIERNEAREEVGKMLEGLSPDQRACIVTVSYTHLRAHET